MQIQDDEPFVLPPTAFGDTPAAAALSKILNEKQDKILRKRVSQKMHAYFELMKNIEESDLEARTKAWAYRCALDTFKSTVVNLKRDQYVKTFMLNVGKAAFQRANERLEFYLNDNY